MGNGALVRISVACPFVTDCQWRVISESVAMFSLTCCLATPPLRTVVMRPVPFVTSCRLACHIDLGWLTYLHTNAFCQTSVSTGCQYSSQLLILVSNTGNVKAALWKHVSSRVCLMLQPLCNWGSRSSGMALRRLQTFRDVLWVSSSSVRSRVQKFPAWHTKAAPNGKCCEGYIVPSTVRLMYQLKSVLK